MCTICVIEEKNYHVSEKLFQSKLYLSKGNRFHQMKNEGYFKNKKRKKKFTQFQFTFQIIFKRKILLQIIFSILNQQIPRGK